MSDHISKSLIEQFRDRSLDAPTLSAIAMHLEDCTSCYELFREARREKRSNTPAYINLSSESWLKDEHLDYEQIVSYEDSTLDADDREILDIHLKLCNSCLEAVQSFTAHRLEIKSALNLRSAPTPKQSLLIFLNDWWKSRGALLKPAYAIYTLLLIGSLTMAIVLLRQGKTDERTSLPVPPIANAPATVPSVENRVTPPIDPSEKPGSAPQDQHLKPPGTDQPIISVRDGDLLIALAAAGNLKGLDDLPDSIRQPLKDVLLSGTLQHPAILNDIAVERGTTRTNTTGKPSFKLISPQQVVVLEDRPTFRWEPLAGASGYKVHVASVSEWAAIYSPRLNSATVEWTPPTPLARGKAYTWVVTAITEKGELTVPASSDPERKFKVLAERDFSRLSKLRRQTSSHLVLGIFYARSGLVLEAERELQLLANQNADSTFVAKLLNQVRSWR